MKSNCCKICNVVLILIIIGAINWGLVGLFQFDLVGAIFGPFSLLSRLIYILVGAAGVLKLVTLFKECPACKKGPMP